MDVGNPGEFRACAGLFQSVFPQFKLEMVVPFNRQRKNLPVEDDIQRVLVRMFQELIVFFNDVEQADFPSSSLIRSRSRTSTPELK